MSAAQGVNLDRFYSYDVACQWCIHLVERVGDLPKNLRPPAGVKLEYGVPKCHAKGHILLCQSCYSMQIQLGVGQTDAEGIERCWAGINHSAPSTKEMTPGHRHDMLDRRMGTHNWEKVIRMGMYDLAHTKLLLTKNIGKHLHGSLDKELERYKEQLSIHNTFTAEMPPGQTSKWEKQVTEWENGRTGDRKTTSPYWRERTCESSHPTGLECLAHLWEDMKERELIQKLNEEDRLADKAAIHDMNVVAFIQLGMKIEKAQYVLVSPSKFLVDILW